MQMIRPRLSIGKALLRGHKCTGIIAAHNEVDPGIYVAPV